MSDPKPPTTQVNFWRSLDEALKRVEAQLGSPGVRLTLRVLKQARRIIAVAALEGGNTGMDHANKVCMYVWMDGHASLSPRSHPVLCGHRQSDAPQHTRPSSIDPQHHEQQVVADVLAFLRDLPVPALLSASSVDQLGAALQALFHHMGRLRHSKVRERKRTDPSIHACVCVCVAIHPFIRGTADGRAHHSTVDT